MSTHLAKLFKKLHNILEKSEEFWLLISFKITKLIFFDKFNGIYFVIFIKFYYP